jgi:hypothetical protein
MHQKPQISVVEITNQAGKLRRTIEKSVKNIHVIREKSVSLQRYLLEKSVVVDA